MFVLFVLLDLLFKLLIEKKKKYKKLCVEFLCQCQRTYRACLPGRVYKEIDRQRAREKERERERERAREREPEQERMYTVGEQHLKLVIKNKNKIKIKKEETNIKNI